MKKLFFIALAAVAMMTTACGSKQQKDAAEGEQTEQAEKTMTWQTYTNDNYGYSIEVPGDMRKNETLIEDNGTIFSYDKEGEITFNRIDISGGKSYDTVYTPEKVKEEYDYWTQNKDIVNEELGDNYFTYTILGDLVNEIDYYYYHGSSYLIVVICYDSDHEKDLAGDVAKHVFNSIKFK